MQTVTSSGLSAAIGGLSILNNALSAVETATSRRKTPGRLAQCEKIVDQISCRDAGQLRYAAEAGVPLSEVWDAVSARIHDLLDGWSASDIIRANMMQ
jgi:uncharacterized membrane protein